MATLADVIKKYGSMENFKAQTAQPVQPAQMPVQNVGVAQTTTPAPVQATLQQQTTVAPTVSAQTNPNKEGTLAYNIWEKNNTANLPSAAAAQAMYHFAPVDNSVVFGQQAAAKQATDTQYLDKRNQQIATELTKSGKTSADVANYLKTQPGFIEADADAQKNTIDSISKLMGGQPAVEGPNNLPSAAAAQAMYHFAPVDNSVVFGQQASDKQAIDTTYLDKRNEKIAQQTIDQLNSIANQGQKVDATTRDSVMEGLIAKAGGQVQWDNRDRQNTIDQINTKVLQQTGSKDWNTAFSTINKPYTDAIQYTNGESLGKALDSGLVSASQLENIKKFNPTVYEEYQNKKANDANLALVNMSKPTTSALVADKGIDIGQLFQSLGLDMTKSADIDLVAKRQELYNTGEVKTSQDTYLKDKKELETLQDTYTNIEDDVRAEYEGTGVTESFIMAKVANRQKPIYKQLQTQQRNYNNSIEAMQLAMGNAKDELDIYAQQATLDRQQTAEKLQMGQFAYGIMADQQEREDKFKLADIQFQQEKDMLAYKYDMEYGDINSSDPRIQQRYFDRISEDFVKQYEGLVKSTPQQLSARIKADVQSGKTIGQAMNTIMEDLKKNENYGAYIKKKAGVDDAPFEIGGVVYKRDSNGNVTPYNITTQTDSSIPGNIENPNSRNKSATPAVRNNNPGNITDLGFGGKKVEGERFTVFETPQQGFQALVSKIQNIQNGGSKTYSAGMTLTQFFGKYAPSSDNNNPDQYAISVANRLGVTANTTVGQVDPVKLAWEISRHEDINMYNLLKSGATTAGAATGTAGNMTIDQIILFNDDVSRREMDAEQIRAIGDAKSQVMSDPNASIEEILKWSNGGKAIGETQSKQFIKFDQAMEQLELAQKQISKQKTGPILGKLRGLNPRDTDAQVLKATLQGLIPTMARGVYGEVGVLTDNDIRLYAKTLPNLTSTDAVNKAVLAMTLDVLAGGYKRNLTSMAGQGYDVSGLSGTYQNIKSQANALRQEIGMQAEAVSPTTNTNIFSNAFTSAAPVSDVYGVNAYISALYGQ